MRTGPQTGRTIHVLHPPPDSSIPGRLPIRSILKSTVNIQGSQEAGAMTFSEILLR
ncbi:MAG: hypothetical protein ABSB22_17475 [Thermodesulfobacteriota bacterium]|jgi:hypothetical protein